MSNCGSKRKMAYGGKVKKMKEGGMSKMKPAKPAELVKKVTSVEKQKMDSAKQMAYGGKVKKMKSGGKVRGDGICKRGKTKGRMV
jgi:hypothetical protein